MPKGRSSRAPRFRSLRLERLEDRAMLDVAAEAVVAPAELDDAPAIMVDLHEMLDGAAIRIRLEARYSVARQTAEWSIDWGDGATETITAVANSITVAHYYSPELSAKSYDVRVALVDADYERVADGEWYYVASHTAPGTLALGDYATSSFCDAEKYGGQTSNLCWANGAANALYYTGWATDQALADLSGEEYAFENEDDVFEYLANSFTNKGASALFAAEWFITGDYQGEALYGWAQLTRDGGGFYPNVEFDQISLYYSYKTSDKPETILPTVAVLLQNDWGVCVSLAYYSSRPGSTVTAAHTLTLWGYECDLNYAVDDPRYFTAIVVSDSDDGANRGRYADNTTKRIQIEWSDEYSRYRLVDYLSVKTPWIEETIAVAPKERFVKS